MPHIEKAYEKYKDDPRVAFVLVSIDDDPERLARYVGERRLGITLARLPAAEAEAGMGVTDIPATFYVDAAGVVRYQVRGIEPHGDSAERIAWYIDELKRGAVEPGR